MGAQNFNFAHKFPRNGGLSAAAFAFLDENFFTRIKFSNSSKFTGGNCLPPAMTPLGKETFDIVQDHDEDDDEWDDANNDDDEDDDDMNETDSLPGLLSQLAGDGRCLRMSFIS